MELFAIGLVKNDSGVFLESASCILLVDCQRPLIDFQRCLSSVSQAGVDLVQVRDKNADARTLLRYIQGALEAVDPSTTRIVVNDRVDLAMAANCSMVHVGQEDLDLKDVRAIATSRMAVGVSTHSIEQARSAVEAGADYIGCGPTFTSTTKSFDQFPGLSFLQQVAESIALPAYAIGGITLETLPKVIKTGIHGVAVSAAIWKAPHPELVARQFKELLEHSS